MKSGPTTASLLIAKLHASSRQGTFAKALHEYGRLIRTIYLCRYVADAALRRRVRRQLNKGESLHALRRDLFFAHQGHVRRRHLDDCGLLRNPAEERRATDELISDVLGAVFARATDRSAPPAARPAAGQVAGWAAAGRALVRVDDGSLATIWSDLLVPGHPIERLVSVGMPVHGKLDPTLAASMWAACARALPRR